AVKFTERGQVLVRLRPARPVRSGRDGLAIELSVTDTGIGLSAQARSHLFQPFTQADGSTTRRYGGSGLGLAISKRLVDLMGGRIDVRSTPGSGSCFSVRVELQKLAEQVAPDASTLVGHRVLLSGDATDTLGAVSHYLCHAGARVETLALDLSDDALAGPCADGVDFDLIVVDAEGDTEAALASDTVREVGRPGHRPMLVLSRPSSIETASDDPWVRELRKPVRRAELLNAVQTLLSKEASSCSNAQPPRMSRRALGARVLMVEDNPMNLEIGVAMLNRLGCEVGVAVDGVAAVAETARVDYDVILMDCDMPHMDGFEATRIIRARAEGTSAPRVRPWIVALTANAMAGDRERCLAAGMDAYLAKPYAFEQLAEQVEQGFVRQTVAAARG
ncbi:MAG: response regulator, partial [Gammaproteobacteria bacterium]|nr:response regulator [Gammaproteobacteria bacterium]